jgi:hypothetical protein
MPIIERVQKLNLPLNQTVVIGSGVLDALGLRKAGDIDLVLSRELFDVLSQDPGWHKATKRDEPILTHDDTEAFLSWGSNAVPNFEALYSDGITIGGVRFANPRFVIAWKQSRLNDKDKTDIALLESYLHHER